MHKDNISAHKRELHDFDMNLTKKEKRPNLDDFWKLENIGAHTLCSQIQLFVVSLIFPSIVHVSTVIVLVLIMIFIIKKFLKVIYR